ncbi:MAG TPA: cupredoxin family copper-binding protein [Actinophytocola sp.]|jgi:amicyanin|uniref:cupredoxin domain-containing protein n=1 Tax=Actinophytocola sp. TaxID=1872138 RepID=UPI002DF84925|nr:cupredoxin family copper-binding protein [Actinophytocola sp.]
MNQSNAATLVAERVAEEEASPPTPASVPPRRRLLLVLAVVALAGTLISLASLRLADSAPARQVGVDDKAVTGILPGDLSGVVPDLGNVVPAPAQAAPGAAAAPAEAKPAAAASSTSVAIMNFAYSPATLTITVGDTVTWTNHDSAPHNVVVSDGPEKFTSPTLQTGQSFSYTFTKAGTYAYYCSIHPNMKATVTVQGGGTDPPPTTPPGTGKCVSKQVLDTFMAHVKSAHLERGPLDQVTDILSINQYVLTHTVWVEQLLQPLYDGTGDQAVKDALAPLIAHINSAHLERSPLQQVTDILAADQYVATHTAMIEAVVAPLAAQATC